MRKRDSDAVASSNPITQAAKNPISVTKTVIQMPRGKGLEYLRVKVVGDDPVQEIRRQPAGKDQPPREIAVALWWRHHRPGSRVRPGTGARKTSATQLVVEEPLLVQRVDGAVVLHVAAIAALIGCDQIRPFRER